MDNNEITLKARGIASCLTYNEGETEAAAKHIILELSHRLDSLNIRCSKKSDGLLLINGKGKSRYATFKEALLYKLFGVLPKEI